MGNSIYGQMPSKSWELIRLRLQTLPRKDGKEFEDISYDLYNVIKVIAELEVNEQYPVIEDVCLYRGGRLDDDPAKLIHRAIAVDAKLVSLVKEIKAVVLIDPGTENAKITDTDDTPDTIEIDKDAIACDIGLLECTYGHLQAKLALKMLNSINMPETETETETRNLYVRKEFERLWNSYSDEEKSATNLQNKTMEIVQPSNEAISAWKSWGIM